MSGIEDRTSRKEEYEYLYQIWKDFNTIAEEGEEARFSNATCPTFEELKSFFNSHITSEEFREKMYFFNGTVFRGYENDREKFNNESDGASNSGINAIQTRNCITSDSESDEQIIRDIKKDNSNFEKLSEKVENFLTESYKRFPPGEESRGLRDEFKSTGVELYKNVQKFIKNSDERMKKVEDFLKKSKPNGNASAKRKLEKGKSCSNNNPEPEEENVLNNWIILLDKCEFERDSLTAISSTSVKTPKYEPTSVTETYNIEPEPLAESSVELSSAGSRKNKNIAFGGPKNAKKTVRKTSWLPEKNKKRINNRENFERFKSKKPRDDERLRKKKENLLTSFLDESDVDDEKYNPRSQGLGRQKLVNSRLEFGNNFDLFIDEDTNSGIMNFGSESNSQESGSLKKSRRSGTTLENEMRRLRDPRDEPIQAGRRKTFNSISQKLSNVPNTILTESFVEKMFGKFKMAKAKFFPPGARGNEVLVKKSEKEAFKYTEAKTVEGYKVYTCPHCKNYGRSVRAIYQLKTSYLKYDDEHISSCPVVPWPL